MSDWEVIIGLEIHAQLNTRSKLFSHAPNRFGDEPNTNITDVCTGQPGSLPVLNAEAVRKAVRFGCAINGQVATFSKFDRKSYFYPDSPRNFQITQYDQPIILGGTVIAEVEGQEHSFSINRVHLEDDAGMLKHFSTFVGVDYNRAGAPLIEIVSEPCIYSPAQARAYAMAIKAILEYTEVANCNMAEGGLRFDANISVRQKGEQAFRNKTEIKNMNSFNFLELALKSEIKRQIALYESDPTAILPQETYRWDPDQARPVLMRTKESADDYRYFPEPDLPPIILQPSYIEEIRAGLPELPLQRERRYVQTLGLPPDSAFILTSDKALSDYFEQALLTATNPRTLCNWLIIEFAGRYKDSGTSLLTSGIPAEHVAELLNLIEAGTITGKIAKAVADEMVANPTTSPTDIVNNNPDYQPMTDTAALEAIVDTVLSDNSQSVEDFRAGKERALGFLVGQVMKQTRGKASPDIVNQLIKSKIKAS